MLYSRHTALCVICRGFNVEKVLDGCREYFDVTEMNGTDNMESELAKLYDEGEKGIRILCRKRKMVQACAEKS